MSRNEVVLKFGAQDDSKIIPLPPLTYSTIIISIHTCTLMFLLVFFAQPNVALVEEISLGFETHIGNFEVNDEAHKGENKATKSDPCCGLVILVTEIIKKCSTTKLFTFILITESN